MRGQNKENKENTNKMNLNIKKSSSNDNFNSKNSSIGSDEAQNMGMGGRGYDDMGDGLAPPSITRKSSTSPPLSPSNSNTNHSHSNSRLDDTKGHVQKSFSPFDPDPSTTADIQSITNSLAVSKTSVRNRAEEEHRKNAFLYLERYEDMVRAQDHEDETTISHLRPIFYTIRRLAMTSTATDADGNANIKPPGSNDSDVSSTAYGAIEEGAEENGDDAQEGAEEVLQKDAFISAIDNENKDDDDKEEELATPLEDILKKADSNASFTEENKSPSNDDDKEVDDDDDEFNQSGKRGLGKSTFDEDNKENDNNKNNTDEIQMPAPSNVDRENSITSVVIETDDDEVELETSFNYDYDEEKVEEGVETLYLKDKDTPGEADQDGAEKKEDGDNGDETSFTVNQDGTFMENGSGSNYDQAAAAVPTQSPVDVARDTSFTADHENTFMKTSSTPSDEVTAKTATAAAATTTTFKTVPDEKTDAESSNYDGSAEAPAFVSTGYLDTTSNTTTDPMSVNNDHNIVLSFDAISQFVDKIKSINEMSGDIPSGPKSDYHILQTDAQLMLILTTISEAETEALEDYGDDSEAGPKGKDGLTFAEFVHVYKNVIAGMQTLQMLPASSNTSIATFDPTHLDTVREMTRERTLQMIRAFNARSVSDLESFLGDDDDNMENVEEKEKGVVTKERVMIGCEEKFEDDDAKYSRAQTLNLIISEKDTELEKLRNELKQTNETMSKSKGSKLSVFMIMLISLACGAAIGHEYFSYQSNELAKLDIIEVQGKLNSSYKEIKALGVQVDSLNSDLKKKEASLVKKDEKAIKCEKTLNSIEDYYNGDVRALKRELEECQESSNFNPSESNVQEAKMVIKSSQSLQKVVLHRQVMTAVGTALIAAVPSFLKFLLNVLFF